MILYWYISYINNYYMIIIDIYNYIHDTISRLIKAPSTSQKTTLPLFSSFLQADRLRPEIEFLLSRGEVPAMILWRTGEWSMCWFLWHWTEEYVRILGHVLYQLKIPEWPQWLSDFFGVHFSIVVKQLSNLVASIQMDWITTSQDLTPHPSRASSVVQFWESHHCEPPASYLTMDPVLQKQQSFLPSTILQNMHQVQTGAANLLLGSFRPKERSWTVSKIPTVTSCVFPGWLNIQVEHPTRPSNAQLSGNDPDQLSAAQWRIQRFALKYLEMSNGIGVKGSSATSWSRCRMRNFCKLDQAVDVLGREMEPKISENGFWEESGCVEQTCEIPSGSKRPWQVRHLWAMVSKPNHLDMCKNGYVVYGDPRKRLEVEIQKKTYLINVLESILFFPTPWVFFRLNQSQTLCQVLCLEDGALENDKASRTWDIIGTSWDAQKKVPWQYPNVPWHPEDIIKYRCCEIGC